MFRLLTALAVWLTLPLGALAQDARRDVMVVLDMSGSMWGQVDGVAKVELARDAFAGLADDWRQADVAAGLIAYGHRRRGDCTDIEILAQPSDGADLAALANGLLPRGKTPLSEAVRAAADALRFTENAATVVLISDGVETCQADPCAVAADLERLGIDFTAHVVGFDIAEGDRAQLQCIAEETGGLYFDAADAGGLSDAMDAVVVATEVVPTAPPPAPIERAVRVRVDAPEGTVHPAQTQLSVDGVAVTTLDDSTDHRINGVQIDLAEGTYTYRAKADRMAIEQVVEVSAETEVIVLTLEAMANDWQLWRSGPFPLDGADKQYVGILASGGAGRESTERLYLMETGATDFGQALSRTSLRARADEWQHAQIAIPDHAGSFDLVLVGGGEEAMRLPITFADTVEATWLGPREVAAGARTELRYQGDWGRQRTLRFAHPDGASMTVQVEGTRTADGFYFAAPEEPGLYAMSLHPNVVSAIQDVDGTPMGQLAVGVPMPVSDPEPGIAQEADDMGGEEAATLAPGDLQGDWTLIFAGAQRSIDLVDVQLIHDEGGQIAEGGTVVRAGDSWGLGPTGSFGLMTLTRTGPDAYDLTIEGDVGVATGQLNRTDGVWRGTLRTDAPYDVALIRPDAAPPAVAKPNRLTAVDERGASLDGPVDWTLTAVDGAPEVLRSDGAVLYEEARAPDTYTVTARSGDLVGGFVLQVGPGLRGGNRVILRRAAEGDALPIDVVYFCSPGEDCAMADRDLGIDFTLPVGWGAERPYLNGSDVVMTFATADPGADGGVLYATLNLPQRMASLGPCRDVLRGTFCHDTTTDPARLADVEALAAGLSYVPAGDVLEPGDTDALLQRLMGASQ
ncbi:MAG: vWA domain-containing protein [Shimia sp.]